MSTAGSSSIRHIKARPMAVRFRRRAHRRHARPWATVAWFRPQAGPLHAVVPSLGLRLSGLASAGSTTPGRHARPWAWHPRVHQAEIAERIPFRRSCRVLRARTMPCNSWMPGPSPGMTTECVAPPASPCPDSARDTVGLVAAGVTRYVGTAEPDSRGLGPGMTAWGAGQPAGSAAARRHARAWPWHPRVIGARSGETAGIGRI